MRNSRYASSKGTQAADRCSVAHRWRGIAATAKLVKLPKTGAIILSGDAAHFKENWDSRRVPAFNTDKGQTLASMQRIADLLAQNQAQLWINHDLVQSKQQKHAPEFYD